MTDLCPQIPILLAGISHEPRIQGISANPLIPALFPEALGHRESPVHPGDLDGFGPG